MATNGKILTLQSQTNKI